MEKKFWKVHSCGNDFIFTENWVPETEQIVSLCDRRRGVGADGVLVLSDDPLIMRIFNSDGSEASMCGNGLRCFMMMAVKLGYAEERQQINTAKGPIEVLCTAKEPFACEFELEIKEEDMYIVSGTRHTVLFESFDNDKGMKISKSLDCNVDFVTVIDKEHIQVSTWERGAGPTEACGTGASASVMAAWQNGFINDEVTVLFQRDKIHCKVKGDKVFSEGNAYCVFEGKLEI